MSPKSDIQKLGIHKGFASCYRAQKKFEKALTEIDEALKNPLKDSRDQSVDLQMTRAFIYLDKEEPGKACEIFQIARDLSPKSDIQKLDIHKGFVRCYRVQKKFEKALAEINEALKLPSRDQQASLLALRGQFYRMQGKYDTSRKDLQQALKVAKDDVQKIQIYSELALLSKKLNVEQSLKYYKIILNIVTNKSDDFYRFIQQYFSLYLKNELKKTIDVDRVKNLLLEVEKDSETNEDLLLNRQVQLLFNHTYKILESLSKENKPNPFENLESFKRNSVFSNSFWAGFYFYKKDLTAAKKRYNDVLSLNPKSPVGYGGLENIALLESDNFNLLNYYSKAKRSVGNHWYSFLQLPLSLANEKVLAERDPDRVALELKLIAPAIVEYNNVLYSALGQMYLQSNRLDEAEMAFERAQKDEGSTANAHRSWSYLGLAVIAIKRGNLELSDNYSKLALEYSNNQVKELVLLAAAYEKVDAKRAKEFYKKVVTIRLNQMKWEWPSSDEFIDEGNNPSILSNAYLQIGNLELVEGDFINARANFKKVIKLGIEQHKVIALKNIKALPKAKLNIKVKIP